MVDISSDGVPSSSMDIGVEDAMHDITIVLPPIPCLLCASDYCANVKSEVNEASPKGLFGGLCSLFKIQLRSNLKWWSEWSDGTEPMPICGECMHQLQDLLDVQRKLNELEKAFQDGLKELKEKCLASEEVFKSGNVYGRDERYLKMRQQICARRGRCPLGLMLKKSPVPPTVSTRRSCKRDIGENGKSFSTDSSQPLVKLSVTDKVNADKYVLQSSDSFIKAEAEVHLDLDEDNWIAEATPEISDWQRKNGDSSCGAKSKGNVGLKKLSQRQLRTKSKRNGVKSKEKVKKSSKKKIKERKIVYKSEDECDSEEDVKMLKPKYKRKKPEDEDFIMEKDQSEASDENDGVEEESFRDDPQTNTCKFLHVTFLKIGDIEYQCTECKNGKPLKRTSLKRHVFCFHSTRFACKRCNFNFGAKRDLLRHIESIHEGRKQPKKFVCPICDRPFYTRNTMIRHKFTHYNEQDLEEAKARGEKIMSWKDAKDKQQCELCGKTLHSKCDMKQHMKVVHGEILGDTDKPTYLLPRTLCPECGKEFTSLYLKTHMEKEHSTPEEKAKLKRFMCTDCDKRFLNYASLMKHKVVHTGIRPFKCTLCPKDFGLKRQLNNHLKHHQNIRQFQCAHCPMAFVMKHYLKRHEKIYHAEGANPKRKTYVRGPETKRTSKPYNPSKVRQRDNDGTSNNHSSAVTKDNEATRLLPIFPGAEIEINHEVMLS